MKRHRLLIAALLAAVVMAIGARIWWVNANLPRIPLEYYEQGEWVPLEGAFQSSADEGTGGYSVMVEDATITTYDGYLEAHGDGTQELGGHGSARCVVDVTLRIRNEGTDQGGLNTFQMVLVPARANEYLICDVMNPDALWPQVQEGAGSIVSIRPGTEYVVHIPYVFNGNEEVYEREITDRSFTLLASRMPVRKMIEVTAGDAA